MLSYGPSTIASPSAPRIIRSGTVSPSNSQAEYFKYRQSLADIEKKKFSDADRKSIEKTAESNDIATAGFALLELSAAYHQGLYPQNAGLDLL